MSAPFSTPDAVTWTQGRLAGGEGRTEFRGAGIDTRTIAADELFVAIRGDNHDAHGFIGQAIERGASGVVVEEAWLAENPPPQGVCTVGVADTTKALAGLAHGHRSTFAGPVVAVTGSNGKTTTKEMIHAILSVKGPCLKNQGNLNNEFGLPLTLLSRTPDDERVVVELGMNHRGEIARLTAIANPDIGVITNVGSAHIEFLGSREEIAAEKGDLIAGLGPGTTAILNHDDALAMTQAKRTPGTLRTFGRQAGADITAEDVRSDATGHYRFRLVTPEGQAEIRIQGLAEITVINSLAAAAACLAAGAKLDDIVQGLDAFRGVPGRMATRPMKGGGHVIDDTYNANPQSMQSALETLMGLDASGRKIAVVGDMGELGGASEAAHRRIGQLAAQLDIDELFAVGENAHLVAEEAVTAGMKPERIHVAKGTDQVGDAVRERTGSGDWVLIKGSRAMRMERLVERLAAEETN